MSEEFASDAERSASLAERYASFDGINLLGIKRKVALLLALIGTEIARYMLRWMDAASSGDRDVNAILLFVLFQEIRQCIEQRQHVANSAERLKNTLERNISDKSLVQSFDVQEYAEVIGSAAVGVFDPTAWVRKDQI